MALNEPVWPDIEELRRLSEQIDALATQLRAGDTAGGSANRWQTIDYLRTAARYVFNAARYVETAPDRIVRTDG